MDIILDGLPPSGSVEMVGNVCSGGTSVPNQARSSGNRRIFWAETRSFRCSGVRGPIMAEVMAGWCKIHAVDSDAGH